MQRLASFLGSKLAFPPAAVRSFENNGMEVMNSQPQGPTNGTGKQSSDNPTKDGVSQLLPRQDPEPQTPANEQHQQPSKPQETVGDGSNKPPTTTAQSVLGKENRLSRPSMVQGLAEWEFPENVGDKSAFVSASLQHGSDATPCEPSSPQCTREKEPAPIRTPRPTRGKRKRYDEKTLEGNVIGFQDKRECLLFSSPQNRGRRTHDDDDDDYFEKTIVPKAFNIEFDRRFVKYAVAPDGSEQKEKFVWSFEEGDQAASLDLSEARIEEVPDLPKRTMKGRSRVGPMYQARIPAFGELEDGCEPLG